jgi:hypothetical protein
MDDSDTDEIEDIDMKDSDEGEKGDSNDLSDTDEDERSIYSYIEEDYPDGPFINDPLEVLFDENKPDDIDAEEAKVITTLIRQILKYDPSQRPSAEEILGHPWFRD